MNTEQIKDILLQRGYSERNAAIASKELVDISDKLTPILMDWLNDENCQKDYSVEGHSIQECLENGMKYPAAILTMDWLIKDPKVALRSLTKGTR
ncbi:hypothetical protein [Prevotella sp. E13-27]|uniref:hypothetical protein n=1 Tax=Prevotella sp. E13-27 TaxID=2938122 RepID=UPI00200AAA16|nr:hypothetical protein [Prevotella sp. E13-27]MCK8622521.1 hypothetical protein [Prevotella sp. E13-27]